MTRNIYSRLAAKHTGGRKKRGGDGEVVEPKPVVKEPSFVERLLSQKKDQPEPVVEAPKEPSFVEKLLSYKDAPPVEVQPETPQPVQEEVPVIAPVAPIATSQRGFGYYLWVTLLSIIALGTIGSGLYLLIKPSETADANITIVNCQKKPCILTISFTTKNGTAISGTRTVIGHYTEGQKIKVQYNPDTPNNFAIANLSSKTFGAIWLSIGLFILIVLSLYLWMNRNN
jgi:hypothetical protein